MVNNLLKTLNKVGQWEMKKKKVSMGKHLWRSKIHTAYKCIHIAVDNLDQISTLSLAILPGIGVYHGCGMWVYAHMSCRVRLPFVGAFDLNWGNYQRHVIRLREDCNKEIIDLKIKLPTPTSTRPEAKWIPKEWTQCLQAHSLSKHIIWKWYKTTNISLFIDASAFWRANSDFFYPLENLIGLNSIAQ